MFSKSLEDKSLSDVSLDIGNGRETSVSLTKHYLKRISDIDQSGPSLNSVISINPRALEIAATLDQELNEGIHRGPLHGIPILLKDNIETCDPMPTTAGSLALQHNMALSDAHIAKRLRDAGAVILGKTNLSEWANGRSTSSTSGWSAVGGLSKNPYALDRNPSGSSSGSAIAVASGLCAAAIGTETDGSILSPSSICSVVGLKPTVGLISRGGIIPLARSLDTPGPIAKTVRDCAMLLTVLAGCDEFDEATCTTERYGSKDYLCDLDVDALKGARLGVARQFFGFHKAVDAAFGPVLQSMKDAGAALIELESIPKNAMVSELKRTVLLYEMKEGLNRYLSHCNTNVKVKSLADLIRFNQLNSASEMKWFDQNIFEMANSVGDLSDAAYLDALLKMRTFSRVQGIERTIFSYGLDAIIAPTEGPAWTTDLLRGDYPLGGSTSPSATAGTPSISVPAANIFGLPLGISFFAEAWSEAKLLRLASAFEKIAQPHLTPMYLSTINLV